MMMLFHLLIGASSASGVHLEPATPESDVSVPNGWRVARAATSSRLLNLTVALHQDGTQTLQDTLLDISDPTSDHYGEWLSPADVQEMVYVPASRHRAVVGWLESNRGVVFPAISSQSYLTVQFSVADAERAFEVKLAEFEHIGTGSSVLRCAPGSAAYSVPPALASSIDLIDGLTGRLPLFSRRLREKQLLTNSDDSSSTGGAPRLFNVTPAWIKKRYGVVDSDIPRTGTNLQSVASFLGQYYVPSDLEQFQTQNSLASAPVKKTIGPNNASKPGIEAQLDVQFLLGIADGIDSWVWSTAGEQPGSPGNEPFLQWLLDVSAASGQLPNVFSISYQDYEDTVRSITMLSKPRALDHASCRFLLRTWTA